MPEFRLSLLLTYALFSPIFLLDLANYLLGSTCLGDKFRGHAKDKDALPALAQGSTLIWSATLHEWLRKDDMITFSKHNGALFLD